MLHARVHSILGHSVYIWVKRYDFDVRDLLFSSVKGFINYAVKYFINKSVDSHILNSANLLFELLMVGDDFKYRY